MLFKPLTTNHPLCVFIHIGNTGGNSLTNCMANMDTYERDPNFRGVGWRSQLDTYNHETIGKLNFLGGHGPKDDYEGLGRNIELVTMLRNPVRRFISDYNFAKGRLDGQPKRGLGMPEVGWLQRRECEHPELVRSLFSFERFISYYEKYPNRLSTQISWINGAVGLPNPEISVEWHPTRNGKLKPSDIIPGSNTKVWWMCPRGHDYVSEIYGGTPIKPNGCPYCVGKKVGDEINLVTLDKYA